MHGAILQRLPLDSFAREAHTVLSTVPNSSRGASCRGRVWRCLGRRLGAAGLRLQPEVAELDVASHHCFTGGHGQAGQLPAEAAQRGSRVRGESWCACRGGCAQAHPWPLQPQACAGVHWRCRGGGCAQNARSSSTIGCTATPPATEPGCRSRGPTCGRSVQAAWHPPLLQVPAGTRCDAGPAAGGDANMVSIVNCYCQGSRRNRKLQQAHVAVQRLRHGGGSRRADGTPWLQAAAAVALLQPRCSNSNQ